MDRITRTLEVVEIEIPDGTRLYIAPGDTASMTGSKVLGTKKVRAEMPLAHFIAYASIKEVE